jgi:Cohesin domain/Carboxypeptidase regulatory-like domain/MBG domain (YGX type)/Dockerin type I domain
MSQLSTKIRPNIMRINIFYQNTMVKIFTASILFAVLLSVSAPAKASNDTRTSDQNTVATVADYSATSIFNYLYSSIFPQEVKPQYDEPIENKSTSALKVDFEDFKSGTVDGQNRWRSSGNNGVNSNFDVEITENGGIVPTTFGTHSLRLSNAFTSDSVADQTFSATLPNEGGETVAENLGEKRGERMRLFSSEWDFASADPNSEQFGLSVVASPTRNDGSQMSYVRMVDTTEGISVFFKDYRNGVGFTEVNIANGLDRTQLHKIRLDIAFVDGAGNDIAKLYVDNELLHTGTTWEDFYRENGKRQPPVVDSISFNADGIAYPANRGKGFLFDNIESNLLPFPSVLSITRLTPTNQITSASSVVFRVVFDSAVTGVDAGDFSFTGSAVTGSSVAFIASAAPFDTYDITVSTYSGNGLLQLNVVDNDSIVSGGVALGGAGAGNGSFNAGDTYIIDTAVPTVSSINRANPNPTNASSVQFTATFSESVQGVNAADFALATTGTANGSLASVSGSGSVYTITVNGIGGNGTLGLNLVDDDSITDFVLPTPFTLNGGASGSFTGQIYNILENQTITFGALSAKTYGDADFNLTASATSGLTVTFASTTPTICTVSGSTVHIVAAGNCSITASQAGNGSYAPAPDVVQAFTINQAPLTITASSHTVNFGDVAPVITPAYVGLISPATATATAPICITAYSAGLPVSGSPYTTSCSGAVDGNYTISYVVGTVAVNAVPLTITASSHTVSFGGAAPTITPAYVGLVSPAIATATAPVCITAYSAGSPVSGSPYTTSCSGAVDGNYTISYVAGTVAVNAVPLTITSSSHTVNFGDVAPVITASYAGLVSPDTATATPPTCVTAYTALSPVSGSPYSTSCSGAVDGNYTISYVVGTVTVNAVPLTITASSHTVNFGDVAPVITPAYVGLISPATATATAPICVTAYSAGSPVSGSPYTTSCSGAVDGNYTISYTAGTVAVNAVPLTITASSHTVNFGDAAPLITPAYVGLISPATTTATAPVCITAYSAGSPVSGSPYSTSCSGAVDGNYTISYVAGTVIVNQATQTITFTNPGTKTYGAADFLAGASASSGLAVSYSASGNCTVNASSGLIHLTTPPLVGGTCTITTTQAGNGNYFAATPVSQTFSVLANTAPINITMSPISNQLNGAVITVPILVSSTNGHDLGSYDFILTYDPTVLAPIGDGFDIAGTMSSAYSVGSTLSSGTIVVSGFGPNLVNSGTLINMEFTVIGSNPQCSDLNFTSFTFNDDGPTEDASYVNPLTNVCVVNGVVDGTVNYFITPTTANPTPIPSPVPNVTLTAVGGTTISDITDMLGSYLLSPFGNGAYTVTPTKPVYVFNAIGAITSQDASRIQRHVLNPAATPPTELPLTADQIAVADVSGNGIVSSFDAAMIQRFILANPASGATGNWVFQNTTTSYPNVMANQTTNYKALLMGDVTGNWNGSLPPSLADGTEQKDTDVTKETSVSSFAPVAVSLPTTSRGTGLSFSIPVTVGSVTGEDITSFDFDVLYDPTVLQPQAIAHSNAGTSSSGMTVGSSVPNAGRLRISAFGPALTASGALVNLNFIAIGAAGTNTNLTFSPFQFNEGIPTSTLTNGSISILGPTAATVQIGGRVMNAGGRGVSRARVSLTDNSGVVRTVMTNPVGYYRFDNVLVGETYIGSIASKQFTFTPQTVNVSGGLTDLNFTALQP